MKQMKIQATSACRRRLGGREVAVPGS